MSGRYIMAAVALFALALGMGVWLREQQPLEPDNVRRLEVDPTCDLRTGSCRLMLPAGGELSLSVRPQELPPMTPLTLQVAMSGTVFSAVWVDLVGVDMDMGFNRVRLEDAGGGRFSGAGLIPVCVRNRMLWEARVFMTDGEAWLSAPFRFEVRRQ